jgi:hypothetical protein
MKSQKMVNTGKLLVLPIATAAAVISVSAAAKAANCTVNSGACETQTNTGTSAASGITGTSSGSDSSSAGVQGVVPFRTSSVMNGSAGVLGIFAAASGFGYGVAGKALTGASSVGVYGSGGLAGGIGVQGTSTLNNGVFGQSSGSGASGVYGENTTSGGYGVAGRVAASNNTGIAIFGDNTSTSGWAGFFSGRVSVATGLEVNGSCVAGDCSSDIRLKKNVQPLSGALERLVKLRPVTFEWKNPEEHGGRSGLHKGFIAQEVEEVIPEWVGVDGNGFKTVDTRGIEATAMLVESVRTLKAKNDALEQRMRALEESGRTSRAGLAENAISLAGLGALAAFVLSRRKRPLSSR